MAIWLEQKEADHQGAQGADRGEEEACRDGGADERQEAAEDEEGTLLANERDRGTCPPSSRDLVHRC